MILNYLPSPAFAIINNPNDAQVIVGFFLMLSTLGGVAATVWLAFRAQKQTKPNGGSSPHDALVRGQAEVKADIAELKLQFEQVLDHINGETHD